MSRQITVADLPETDLFGVPTPPPAAPAAPKPPRWQTLKVGTAGDCDACLRRIHQMHIAEGVPWANLPRPSLAVARIGTAAYCQPHAEALGYKAPAGRK